MYTHTSCVCVYAMVAFKRREEFEFIQEPLYSCISSKGYEKNRKRYRKIQFKNVLHLNSTLAPRLRLGEAREWRTNTSCRYIAFFCELSWKNFFKGTLRKGLLIFSSSASQLFFITHFQYTFERRVSQVSVSNLKTAQPRPQTPNASKFGSRTGTSIST